MLLAAAITPPLHRGTLLHYHPNRHFIRHLALLPCNIYQTFFHSQLLHPKLPRILIANHLTQLTPSLFRTALAPKLQAELKETLSVLKLPVHSLLVTKRCPSWTPSLFQVALKLLALLLKLKAEVKDPPGVGMHATLAAFVATQSVSEIAGPRAAVALNPAVPPLVAELPLMAATVLSAAMLVNAAMAQTGRCEQLASELHFAILLTVPIGTAELVLDEAPDSSKCVLWVFQIPDVLLDRLRHIPFA